MSFPTKIDGNILAEILVRHGIIDLQSVEDSEGYDGGLTMMRVRTAAQDITETMSTPGHLLNGKEWRQIP